MALRTSDHFFHSPCTRRVATALSLAVFLTIFASAQNTNGRIIGTVTDTQGAAIAAAKVTVTNVGKNVVSDTVTDNEGYYQVLQLPVGSYIVNIQHAGFAKVVTAATSLDINQSLRIDVHLKPGSVIETVQVAAEAAQVETVNATLGATVTGAPIQDLPLNGRNTLESAKAPGSTPGWSLSSSWCWHFSSSLAYPT